MLNTRLGLIRYRWLRRSVEYGRQFCKDSSNDVEGLSEDKIDEGPKNTKSKETAKDPIKKNKVKFESLAGLLGKMVHVDQNFIMEKKPVSKVKPPPLTENTIESKSVKTEDTPEAATEESAKYTQEAATEESAKYTQEAATEDSTKDTPETATEDSAKYTQEAGTADSTKDTPETTIEESSNDPHQYNFGYESIGTSKRERQQAAAQILRDDRSYDLNIDNDKEQSEHLVEKEETDSTSSLTSDRESGDQLNASDEISNEEDHPIEIDYEAKRKEKKGNAKQGLYDLLTTISNKADEVLPKRVEVPLSRPANKHKRFTNFENVDKTSIEDEMPGNAHETSDYIPINRITEKEKMAVADVAESLGGINQEVTEIKSELMTALSTQKKERHLEMQELLSTMGVKNSKKPGNDETIEMYRDIIAKAKRKRHNFHVKMDVDDTGDVEGLKIFPPHFKTDIEPKLPPLLPTYNAAHERFLNELSTHIPNNGFEEMILWTNQGKLWQFPIDNEIGLEDEKKCGFHEHVFLERHLKGWCPKQGPVRHFMEVICTGLSKNPYMTVERKITHITWFKEYFESKRDILEAVGAYEPLKPKQIESNA